MTSRFYNKYAKGTTLAISGMEKVGKTTTSKCLIQYLKKRGVPSIYMHNGFIPAKKSWMIYRAQVNVACSEPEKLTIIDRSAIDELAYNLTLGDMQDRSSHEMNSVDFAFHHWMWLPVINVIMVDSNLAAVESRRDSTDLPISPGDELNIFLELADNLDIPVLDISKCICPKEYLLSLMMSRETDNSSPCKCHHNTKEKGID